MWSLYVVLSLAVFGIAASGPLHASCTINWTFGYADCDEIKTSLVAQINTWKSADNCKQGGEKCLYMLKSDGKSVVKATHTTPKKHYVDDLTFTFTQDATTGDCNVKGYSTSETWYAVLDYGTNYCNLENLITGAKLNKLVGYEEKTSNKICTQYSSADCNIY